MGVTFLLHIFFDSYSANRKNINVTTLKIYAIISKETIFNSSVHTIYNTLVWLWVKKKLYGNRIVKKLYGNDLPKISKKCAENES